MKSLINIILILFPLLIWSQGKLDGTYHIIDKTGTNYEYLKFDKKGNFEYAKGGDLGEPQSSKGIYKLEKDLLVLNFNNTQSKELGYHKSEIWRNDKNSVILKFKVLDYDGNAIPNAFVSLEKGEIKKRTDKNGEVEFRIKKENIEQEFTISWVGFENYTFKLNLNYNYFTEIHLVADLQEIPIRNQTDSLKILELKKDHFKTANKIWIRSEQEY